MRNLASVRKWIAGAPLALLLPVLSAWLVPGLILASRLQGRGTGLLTAAVPWVVAGGVVFLGIVAWVCSALLLARVRRLPFDRALRADGIAYLWLWLGLPCLAGVVSAAPSLGASAAGCLIAKGLVWRARTPDARGTMGAEAAWLSLALVALLFSLPNVFSARGILPALSASLASRDLSYGDKMAEKWPHFYQAMQFVAASTPPHATVELPPHVRGAAESPAGNGGLGYYFLRPRTLVQPPPGVLRSTSPQAYTLVAHGRFDPAREDWTIWPRELPEDRVHLAMPREISVLLDELVVTGPRGQLPRLDFEGNAGPGLERLASDAGSAVLEHRTVDRGHFGRRSEILRLRFEAGTAEDWGQAVEERLDGGHSISALVLSGDAGAVRLFADVRMSDGRSARLYSAPNSLQRWWDVLGIEGLDERAAAALGGAVGGEPPRLVQVGIQIQPHLERWGLILPEGVR